MIYLNVTTKRVSSFLLILINKIIFNQRSGHEPKNDVQTIKYQLSHNDDNKTIFHTRFIQ